MPDPVTVFYGADRLSGDTDGFGKFFLVQAAFLAQFFYMVLQQITSLLFLTMFLYILIIPCTCIYVKVPLHSWQQSACFQKKKPTEHFVTLPASL